ncbi:serine hydrolase domain-containing protein [Rubellimicrobium roseum]|uniref:Beta-lactamase family protein n=1 Tax=Rubellimicrobium roseum TaxID=687525 RepID=A0A5C4N8B1_9RHOB|nr:serine hydrolase domain-containing protein [Rubellimicrobium roseum]TNC65514.1 beta-lactamase family protein [Rubellimicrobium roseum]
MPFIPISKQLLATTAFSMLLASGTHADHWAEAPPAQLGVSAERLDRLTEVMQGYVDDGVLPGMVILVAKDGQIAYQRAFGHQNIESRTPMAMDTIFRIASQTKAITSAGVLLLQEEGKLLLDDPVGKYMPEWMETTVAVANEEGGYYEVPAKRPITIRDLLTHTSGIPYGAWLNGLTDDAWQEAEITGWYFASDEEPIREIVRRMADLPMIAQPGTEYLYGSNTDILGALIEVVSGQPLDEFFQSRFFDPIGMTDTHFFLPQAKADRLATVYDMTENGLTPAGEAGAMWDQGDYVVGQGPNVTFSGGAGLVSTAHDYAAFLEMLRQGGLAPDGERILSPMTVTLMTTDHLGGIEFSPGAGFSYGFQVALDPGTLGYPVNEGEFGWGGAYHSTYWVDPEEGMVVTYFTQLGEDTMDVDDHGKLRALIYQAMVE